ncbi:hypothetical protein D3C81_1953980 [compost metagenome]
MHIQHGADGVQVELARRLFVLDKGAWQLVLVLLGGACHLDGLGVLDLVEPVDARLHRYPLQQVGEPARADGCELGNCFGCVG